MPYFWLDGYFFFFNRSIMTIHLAYQRLLLQLYHLYDNRESRMIADMVVEHVTGQRKIDRIMYKDIPVSKEQETKLEKLTEDLLNHKPIQYVLGEAWFMGKKFFVNEHVLIPRPETEELVQWIIEETRIINATSLIDIGTGSGCIPVSIKSALPGLEVSAIDISKEALSVADINAKMNAASIELLNCDILNSKDWEPLKRFDIVVSNPPYIRRSEARDMQKNVLHYEPEIALFVDDHTPILFYQAIAQFCKKHLNKGGRIYFEINEALGREVSAMLKNEGFEGIECKKDMQGKDRMIKATLL